jgi:hypothetical protein
VEDGLGRSESGSTRVLGIALVSRFGANPGAKRKGRQDNERSEASALTRPGQPLTCGFAVRPEACRPGSAPSAGRPGASAQLRGARAQRQAGADQASPGSTTSGPATGDLPALSPHRHRHAQVALPTEPGSCSRDPRKRAARHVDRLTAHPRQRHKPPTISVGLVSGCPVVVHLCRLEGSGDEV